MGNKTPRHLSFEIEQLDGTVASYTIIPGDSIALGDLAHITRPDRRTVRIRIMRPFVHVDDQTAKWLQDRLDKPVRVS